MREREVARLRLAVFNAITIACAEAPPGSILNNLLFSRRDQLTTAAIQAILKELDEIVG